MVKYFFLCGLSILMSDNFFENSLFAQTPRWPHDQYHEEFEDKDKDEEIPAPEDYLKDKERQFPKDDPFYERPRRPERPQYTPERPRRD